MEQSTFPAGDIQHERWLWFVRAFHSVQTSQRGKQLSAHALLVEIDIRAAFCAGAWISAIVLACAAVEAQVRQVDEKDYKKCINTLFGSDSDLQWLRALRNELVHAGEPGSPSKIWTIEGHDLSETHGALEADAKRAIEIMFRSIYGKDTA